LQETVYALDRAAREKVARIVAESESVEVESVAGVTAGGDTVRLRGIPAVSGGTSGAVSGSDPLRAL